MEISAYIALALGVLALAGILLRSGLRQERVSARRADNFEGSHWNESSLNLADAIFDPRDYHWLRDRLKFPEGAELLAAERKQLAVEWLRALRASFSEIVRTPDGGVAESDGATRGWAPLWQTLRFYFLVNCAIIAVRIVGPYHRLIPSFSWARPLASWAPRKDSFEIPGRI